MNVYSRWMQENNKRFGNKICDIDNSILLPFNCPLYTRWSFTFKLERFKDQLTWRYKTNPPEVLKKNKVEFPSNVLDTAEVSFLIIII